MGINKENIFDAMLKAKERLEKNAVSQEQVAEELGNAFIRARPKLMKDKRYKHLFN